MTWQHQTNNTVTLSDTSATDTQMWQTKMKNKLNMFINVFKEILHKNVRIYDNCKV